MGSASLETSTGLQQHLEAINTFIQDTTAMTAYQLSILGFMQRMLPPENSKSYASAYAKFMQYDQQVEATIDAHTSELAIHIQTLSERVGSLLVKSVDGSELANMGGVGYSTSTRSYQAVVGVSSRGEPITWPLLHTDQLSLPSSVS